MYSSAPSVHRSSAGPMRSSRACSGEAYAGAANRGASVVPARPKPVTTTDPSSRTNTCPGLSSPCVMPWPWAASSTAGSSSATRAARRWPNAPCRSRRPPSGTPPDRPVTVHRLPSATTASTTGATRPGRSEATAEPVRSTRAAAREAAPPARASGSPTPVTRHGRPVSASSPDQETRFVSRWTTSNRRYRPASSPCVETCAQPMAIPRSHRRLSWCPEVRRAGPGAFSEGANPRQF